MTCFMYKVPINELWINDKASVLNYCVNSNMQQHGMPPNEKRFSPGKKYR